MRFTRFGVTLERLKRKNIETIRRWRNSDWVRPHMRWQHLIEPRDQECWFRSLDPRKDWYFEASSGAQPFGLFHIKEIDWRGRRGEAGGFVGAPEHIRIPSAAIATLALMDFAFVLLGLESLEAQFNPELHRVANFNRRLGYRVYRCEEDGFVRAEVTAERYFSCAAGFRRAALVTHGADSTLTGADPWLHSRVAALGQSPTGSDDMKLVLRRG